LHGGPVLAELTARFGAPARAKVLAGEVVDADGTVVDAATVLPAGASIYLYRELPEEVAVPFGISVLYQDADIVVVDKPHFLATMPRGRHVAQTALVRLRRELGLPELSPAHRLDRLTAGVLLFTTRRELRGTYQTLFARGSVSKTYLARAVVDPALVLPRVVRSRIIKRRGNLQAVCEPGVPNAETLVELISSDGLYRLTPRTGRTHQLRVHMASLGLPITGDPLYPNVIDVPPDHFGTPLQLLAQRIEFDDPVTGLRRAFVSKRTLAGQKSCQLALCRQAPAGADSGGVYCGQYTLMAAPTK
jgi:tRNA pseudouridine32 synthase/23S rRNA pseudouridine746 synthase